MDNAAKRQLSERDICTKFVTPALEAWFAEAKDATWTRPQDVKDQYRSADILPGNRVIFNIKGNRYRLVIRVRYQNGIVYIEWVGTHAEYSRRSFGG